MTDPTTDATRTISQIEQVMRRVKRALYWGNSRDTADFVQGLLEKWIQSDEYTRLLQERPDNVHVYRSARDFVIDHLRRRDAAKRKGTHVPIDDALDLPSQARFQEVV